MRCPGCSRRCLAWFYRYLPVRFLFLLWLFFTGSFIFVFYTNHSRSGFRKHLVSERGTAENRTAENGTAENGTAENGTAENGTAENGTSGTAEGRRDPGLASENRTSGVPLNPGLASGYLSAQPHIFLASPLRIPYQILAGERPRFRKYISIGISSVRRKKENYLLGTLRSVFRQSRESDVEDMVLVVYLADWDPAAREQTAREVSDRFRGQLAARRLLLIASPRAAYPTLEGLKRNYGDSEDRVRYRSKQNVDYAFLSNFCAGLARYHLVLEDDVRCARNFLLSIRRKVEASTRPWTTMAFSKLGYIGKLYHGSDLPALARFLLLFYGEMPCDWLLDHFFRSKAQGELLRVRPSLFQHVGSFSSFQGGANSLKDDEFRERAGPSGDNPGRGVHGHGGLRGEHPGGGLRGARLLLGPAGGQREPRLRALQGAGGAPEGPGPDGLPGAQRGRPEGGAGRGGLGGSPRREPRRLPDVPQNRAFRERNSGCGRAGFGGQRARGLPEGTGH
ncbi:hypothetical protein ANANG_G00209340 [Anguilla anguilla]|uniref:MGAT4 conserved region domain-containing protein n=1 Tax=Anguilla anguilla TaxID=7936 RepID=A0A9D3M149_ANGAN|nr:hypothetical protein ANANG_G00209340 [Anguilla anguilla]